MDAVLPILGAVLSAVAAAWPEVYRAIVPDGRSPEQVVADARAAAQSIPLRPAGDALDEHERRVRGG